MAILMQEAMREGYGVQDAAVRADGSHASHQLLNERLDDLAGFSRYVADFLRKPVQAGVLPSNRAYSPAGSG